MSSILEYDINNNFVMNEIVAIMRIQAELNDSFIMEFLENDFLSKNS